MEKENVCKIIEEIISDISGQHIDDRNQNLLSVLSPFKMVYVAVRTEEALNIDFNSFITGDYRILTIENLSHLICSI